MRRALQLADNNALELGGKLSKLDDLNDLARAGRRSDNISDLSGSQLDAFKSLSKGQQILAVSMQETVTRIAKLPDGTEIIEKLGRKGVSFVRLMATRLCLRLMSVIKAVR